MQKLADRQHAHKILDFNISKWLSLYIFFDLLFLPRLPFLSIPSSLIILAAILIKNKPRKNDFLIYTIFCLIIFLSVLSGSINYSSEIIINNTKRALQICTIILYYFIIFKPDTIIKNLLILFRLFFIYNFFLVVLFFTDASLFELFISIFYPESINTIYDNLMYQRFPYIFEDPNSAGYLLAFVLIAYLTIEKNKTWLRFCLVLSIISIGSTQSRGAYISLLLILFTVVFEKNSRLSTKIINASSIAFLCSIFFLVYADRIDEVADLFNNRIDTEDSLGGGRTGKYDYFFNNLNLLPFGSGYTLFKNGSEFRPHSDFIRLNLSYGLLSIPLLFYFILPRYKSQSLIFLASLIPFFINSLIDDYRLLATYFILISIIGVSHQKNSKHPMANRSY